MALSFALLDRPLNLVLTGAAAALPQAEAACRISAEISEPWEFLRDSAAVSIYLHEAPQSLTGGAEASHPQIVEPRSRPPAGAGRPHLLPVVVARLHILGSCAARNRGEDGVLRRCARLSRRGDSIALLDASLAQSPEAAELAAAGRLSVFAVGYDGRPVRGIHSIGYAGLVQLAEEHDQTLNWC